MAIKKKDGEVEPVTEVSEMKIHKAQRSAAKFRLGICGASGAGKTKSALLVASGLGKKILLVDTESGSGDLYAGVVDYDVLPIEAPFTVQKYIDAIAMGEKEGYDVIILDSISHAWAGSGGLLEQQNYTAKRTGNSYTAWAEVTPQHRKFVDAMLGSKAHIIATMRSKPEYVIEKTTEGRSSVRKLGLHPEQRIGMDHEFTTVFELDNQHTASVSKDRTGLFDQKFFIPTVETGKLIIAWLNGKETV